MFIRRIDILVLTLPMSMNHSSHDISRAGFDTWSLRMRVLLLQYDVL